MFKKGFTLAEVLLTLGIIGVVAALTIPSLISHYHKKVVETRLAKFHSVINQAVQRSIVDNHEPEHWVEDPEVLNGSEVDYNKLYEKYIIPYLDSVMYTDIDNGRIYTMKDGNSFSPNYDEHCSNNDASGIGFAISKDALVNAAWDIRHEKDFGKKIFCFNFPKISKYSSVRNRVTSNTIAPSKFTLGNTAMCAKPFQDDYRELAECAYVIMLNGWKIPDNYPIKF